MPPKPVARSRSDSLEVMISADDANLMARRGSRHLLHSGPLYLFHGKLMKSSYEGMIVRLDEHDWESVPECSVSRSMLRCGTRAVNVNDIEYVDTPVELGAFVFQVHLQGSEHEVVTLRAPTYSAMVDWCEVLWHLVRDKQQLPSSPQMRPHGLTAAPGDEPWSQSVDVPNDEEQEEPHSQSTVL